MRWYYEILRSSLSESLVFSFGCAVAAMVGVLLLRVPFVDGLGFVLLVAGAVLMLIGGALGFISPGNVKLINSLAKSKLDPGPEDYRRSRNRAALYSMTGALLFLYSLLLAAFMA